MPSKKNVSPKKNLTKSHKKKNFSRTKKDLKPVRKSKKRIKKHVGGWEISSWVQQPKKQKQWTGKTWALEDSSDVENTNQNDADKVLEVAKSQEEASDKEREADSKFSEVNEAKFSTKKKTVRFEDNHQYQPRPYDEQCTHEKRMVPLLNEYGGLDLAKSIKFWNKKQSALNCEKIENMTYTQFKKKKFDSRPPCEEEQFINYDIFKKKFCCSETPKSHVEMIYLLFDEIISCIRDGDVNSEYIDNLFELFNNYIQELKDDDLEKINILIQENLILSISSNLKGDTSIVDKLKIYLKLLINSLITLLKKQISNDKFKLSQEYIDNLSSLYDLRKNFVPHKIISDDEKLFLEQAQARLEKEDTDTS